MMRVQDEAQHGMLSNVDLAVRSVTMFRQQTEPTTPPQESGTSITVAIDLGTSNTAVAFSKDGEGSRPIITEIKNYPEDPINRAGIMSSQVPTETLYSKDSKTDGPYFKVETDLTARETDVTAIESNLTDTSFDTMTDYSGNLSDITSNSEDDQELERIYDQSMAEGDDVQSEPGSCYDQSMAEARMEPTDSAEEDMEALCWGHGVRSKLGADLPRSDYNHVAQSKLLLDKVDTSRLKRQARIARNIHRIQETTRRRCNLDPQNNMKTRSGLLIQAAKIPQSNPPSRHRGKDAEYDVLREVVRRLIERKLIRNKLDVIVHFLTQLLRHVKRELADVHNISCPLQIKYVLSVPVTWTSTALLAMQNALRIAIDTSGLGTMDDLFLVSEPEAATNYLIQKNGDLKVCTQNQLQIGAITN